MEKSLEEKARSVLNMVIRNGIDGISVDKDALKYGLEHGLFTQKNVDTAQAVFEYRDRRSRKYGLNSLRGY